MKLKNFRRVAFFKLRVLLACLLCLMAGMLALVGVGAIAQQSGDGQMATSSRWMTRLAGTLGILARAQRFGGGAIKLDKDPAEHPPGTSQLSPSGPNSGPP